MTDQDIIDNGSAAFAGVDAYLLDAEQAGHDIVTVVKAAVEAGWVGALAGKKMINEAKCAAGKIAVAADAFADLHAKCSKIADAKGMPTAPLSMVAGVIVPQSGGR